MLPLPLPTQVTRTHESVAGLLDVIADAAAPTAAVIGPIFDGGAFPVVFQAGDEVRHVFVELADPADALEARAAVIDHLLASIPSVIVIGAASAGDAAELGRTIAEACAVHWPFELLEAPWTHDLWAVAPAA